MLLLLLLLGEGQERRRPQRPPRLHHGGGSTLHEVTGPRNRRRVRHLVHHQTAQQRRRRVALPRRRRRRPLLQLRAQRAPLLVLVLVLLRRAIRVGSCREAVGGDVVVAGGEVVGGGGQGARGGAAGRVLALLHEHLQRREAVVAVVGVVPQRVVVGGRRGGVGVVGGQRGVRGGAGLPGARAGRGAAACGCRRQRQRRAGCRGRGGGQCGAPAGRAGGEDFWRGMRCARAVTFRRALEEAQGRATSPADAKRVQTRTYGAAQEEARGPSWRWRDQSLPSKPGSTSGSTGANAHLWSRPGGGPRPRRAAAPTASGAAGGPT